MAPTDGSSDESADTVVDPQRRARADSPTATASDRPPSSAPLGYTVGELIGRGGMGEVVLADDLQLERKVAIKRMRGEQPTAEAVVRFLREAKIQARLDHPAIVPVHALGHDSAGRPYFTMKRLAGTTLAETICAREPERAGGPINQGAAGTQKLLRAFVDVCLAIDFAHARGVIHRDLKPSNVMLGDYGEVYVLDWGVARLAGDPEAPAASTESADGQTQVGDILGTPGYMSPEQVRGDAITPATDVYGLGAILFEILTGAAAHPRGTAGLASTLDRPAVSPAARAPGRAIAPELDGACLAALAEDPASRPTARELGDRIQRYLDGDRDLERRRALAADHLARARAAVESGDPARRAEAMAAAGRALALDPESNEAASLVTQLMLEPPAVLPAPIEQRLADLDLETAVRSGKFAALALSAYFVFAPLVLWAGVREWSVFLGAFALVSIGVGAALMMTRRRKPQILWAVAAQCALLILFSRALSPFVLIPGLAGGAAVVLVGFPTMIHRPWIAISFMLAAFLVPLGLEATGLWSSTWELTGGKLVIAPTTIALDGTPAVLLLVLGNVAMIAVMAVLVNSVAVAQRRAQRQLEIQAWHLGQLLPVEPPRPPPHSNDRSC